MAKTVATVLGIGFLLIGVIGFFAPSFLGMHLMLGHSVVHLATGAISLFLGLKGSLGAAKTFGIVFGIVYMLLGVAGFLAGEGADRMDDANSRAARVRHHGPHRPCSSGLDLSHRRDHDQSGGRACCGIASSLEFSSRCWRDGCAPSNIDPSRLTAHVPLMRG